jgi:hypothetical protein
MVAVRPVYARLAAAERRALFEGILARCERPSGAPPRVVVFDLDGTLFDNRPRTCAILHELAATWAEREPEIAARLRAAQATSLAYHVSDSLARLGITREDLVKEAFAFWRARFFADPHLRHDVEVPGAVAFARRAYERGASLVYLTGRDLPMMGVGTFASLRDVGFPIGVVGTELVLKPTFEMPDGEFKRFEAPRLGRIGDIVASFDNEPENCNVFAAELPGVVSVFVDTQHLDGAPALDPRVRIVGDFTEA